LNGKKTLVLIVLGLICTLPLVASYCACITSGGRTARSNYGQLLSPVSPYPRKSLVSVKGEPFDFSALKGRWTLVLADSGACDARCEQSLYFIRQARKAQGEHQDRIERVWLVSDASQPQAKLIDAIEGMHVVKAAGSATLAAVVRDPAHARAIYLVDPLGQVMMRYPDEPDPKKMIKDLQRLMKYSRLG
jgi:cytochrome oxidase Cu insertion factor (SCO1/SenC/PrrC family)